jgi:alkanesulfonate monooxygenase SsuD/methylene tetrahydromethanopterin reductase-like flavin-dependent oxidoreductase (luciferase family)
MEHHGTQFKTRFKRSRSKVKALKEIWSKDEAEFHGQFVDFEPIWSWPKPTQRPHPPILLGGESSYTLQRVVDFCDGWYPRGRAPRRSRRHEGAQGAGGQGRTRHEDHLDLRFATPADRPVLDQFAAAGVTRSIFLLPPSRATRCCRCSISTRS